MAGGADTVSATERALSVVVGYSLGAVVVLPFDRTKSLMQVSDAARRQGAMATVRSVLRQQGVRGLYQGGAAHMLIAPYSVLYYSLYDELLSEGRRATTASCGPDGHPLVPLGAAICARTVETTIRMPLELVRTMLQTGEGDLSIWRVLRTQRSRPFSSWFRGFVPTLARDVPFSAIYWAGYEQAKRRLHVPDAWAATAAGRTFLHSFLCGACAGVLAAVLTSPFDVVKTVRQRNLHAGKSSSYASILGAIRDTPDTAFAGLGPRLVRIPAGLATMMAGIELSKHLFLERRKKGAEAPR